MSRLRVAVPSHPIQIIQPVIGEVHSDLLVLQLKTRHSNGLKSESVFDQWFIGTPQTASQATLRSLVRKAVTTKQPTPNPIAMAELWFSNA